MLMSAFTNWLLVFARVGALMAVLPMFSLQNFPVQLRVALSALLALLLSPFLPAGVLEQASVWSLFHVLTQEISVGLLLGFVSRLIFFALEAGGAIIATEMGITMSTDLNPLSGGTTPTPSTLLYWLALMLWLSLDLHHWMIAALQRSYSLVPVGAAHLSEPLLQDIIHRTGLIFVVAIQLAAPILGVSFVITLVFSLLGRAVPQMNVFSESFAVRILAGLIIFGSTCTFMAHHLSNYLRRLPEDVLRVAQLLSSR